MSLSQMQVFNEYIMPATIEMLSQMVVLFNESSRGAIRLTADGFKGDFMQQSFFAAVHSAQRRVNRYAANSAAAVTDLTQLKLSAVKVAGGFGPIRYEPSQMTWLDKPTTEGVEVASRNFAEALIRDQVNTAIAALCAAISNVAALTNDVSGTLGISYTALNNAHAKFGDASGRIVANVMTGEVYHKLIGQNLANVQLLFRQGDVTVVDLLGKAVVITDAPALYVPGTPNKQRVLGLVAGAATVIDAQDLVSNIQTVNGSQRIETTLQMDYSFGLALKGFTWDEVNGGKSPTDALLATGSNWDQVASSIKDLSGVISIGDASK